MSDTLANAGVVLLASPPALPLTPPQDPQSAPGPEAKAAKWRRQERLAHRTGRSFVANTTATTKRFTGPKTAARLALALLQGLRPRARACAYTLRSVTQSVKKKLGREGVTFSEEGVDDFITVSRRRRGPDATTWDDVVGAPAACRS